jgi:hypothetical protein
LVKVKFAQGQLVEILQIPEDNPGASEGLGLPVAQERHLQ